VSARLKPSAWRAWLFALVVFVVNDALVGLGRLESLGFHRVTGDLRYQTELTWLLPLALAFAFHPYDVAGGATDDTRRRTRPAGRRLRIAALAGLACYLVAAVVTAAVIANDWITGKTTRPKAYVRVLRHDGERAVNVLGYERPGFVVPGEEGPWAAPRVLIPTLAPRVGFVLASTTALAIRADGHIRPAHVQPFRGDANRLGTAGTLHVVAGKVNRRGRETCLASGARAGELEFDGRPRPYGPDMYASVTFAVERGGDEPAVVTSTSSGVRPTSLPLDRRTVSFVAELDDPLRVRIPPHAELCSRSVAVGWLET
jgi:hypothetical protein